MQSKVTFMNNVLLLESHNVMQYKIHTVKLFRRSLKSNHINRNRIVDQHLLGKDIFRHIPGVAKHLVNFVSFYVTHF